MKETITPRKVGKTLVFKVSNPDPFEPVSHTPTPWAMNAIYTKGVLSHWGINGVCETGDQFTSGRIVDVPRNAPNHDGPTQEANAAFIVKAVNCHEELLAACKACANAINPLLCEMRDQEHGDPLRQKVLEIQKQARAAISRAEKEGV